MIFCNQMSTDQVKEMLLKSSPRKGVTEIPFLAGFVGLLPAHPQGHGEQMQFVSVGSSLHVLT